MIQSITSFTGMFPRYTSYTLPQNAAQNIVDGRVTSNGLEAYRADVIVKDLDDTYESIYLHHRKDGEPQWLLFKEDATLCRSGIYDDMTNRTFVSGQGPLRVFDDNTLHPDDTTIDSTNSFLAGILVPDAPTMSEPDPDAAVGSEESRTYFIAYARIWDAGKIDLGDLSASAMTSDAVPLTYIDCKTDSTIHITNIKRPLNLSEHNINTVYLYRSSISSEGEASIRYVDSFPTEPSSTPVSNVIYDDVNRTMTYIDTKKEEDLGEEPQNIGWSAPTDGLTGIVSMHNGVFAGFDKNVVYLSVPYQEYAWPATYSYPLDYNVVGLGAFGNTLVICTQGNTFLLNVSDPTTAYMIPIQEAHTCVSRHSIVSLDNACVYATKYGLVQITGNGAQIITKDFISAFEWAKLGPHTIKAAMHRGQYVMFWDPTESSSETFDMRGYVIDFNEITKGVLGLSQYARALYADPVDNSLYLMYKHNIDSVPVIASFADTLYNRRAYTWTSKTFLDNTGLFNLSAGKINFHEGNLDLTTQQDFDYVLSFNPLNHNTVNTFPINGDYNTHNKNKSLNFDKWCILSLYVDNVLRYTTRVYNNKPFRLPAGFRGDSYYITLTSTEPITRVQVASSIGELE